MLGGKSGQKHIAGTKRATEAKRGRPEQTTKEVARIYVNGVGTYSQALPWLQRFTHLERGTTHSDALGSVHHPEKRWAHPKGCTCGLLSRGTRPTIPKLGKKIGQESRKSECQDTYPN
ncbi:hypothetical protein B296_00056628 [Ensete ventricosum]|uniref:Uncharacterized protein n=1 Tax=Ensete ventricosum TaxID=4639 RepID=A0A426WXV7_ENSVE|nr:hypothetical protein B296_00056628 [Ensete ventricosum]